MAFHYQLGNHYKILGTAITVFWGAVPGALHAGAYLSWTLDPDEGWGI